MPKDISLSIDFGKFKKKSRIILSISPCRSCSTAWTRVLSAAGIHSYHQPIKTAYRWKLIGKKAIWDFPDCPVAYFQETLGPFSKEESTLNPLKILRENDHPMENVSLLIIVRDPVAVWSSWLELYGERTCIDYFIASVNKTEQIRRSAIIKNIPTTVIVHESLRDNPVTTIGKSVFDRLQIPFIPNAVTDWNSEPAISNINSYNFMPLLIPDGYGKNDEKENKRREQQLDALTYIPSRKNIDTINKKDLETMQAANLFKIYEDWKDYCRSDLL